MPVFNYPPQFVYPTSRQFPFDEVGEKIVRELEKRNWKVPGIIVKFGNYGSGEAKIRFIHYIQGEDFRITFGSDGISEVIIPQQEIFVFEDESGPTYYLYVGDDWERDKNEFMNGWKVHSKLNKERKTYLKYKGGWSGKYWYQNQRSPLLLADDDLGREYEPEGDEPQQFVLKDKLKEFTDWLFKNVLEYILTFPEEEQIEPNFIPEEIIPYAGQWPLVFTLADWRVKNRIKIGKENPSLLNPEERYVSFGTYPYLVPLDLAENDKELPELAREGFIWCDTNQKITKESSCRAIAFQITKAFDTGSIVAIELKYANHVYVIDNAIFEETKKQIFESIIPRERLTDEELGRVYAARSKSIIPITEYKGNYKEPMVLINRELDFDEIAWVQEEYALTY